MVVILVFLQAQSGGVTCLKFMQRLLTAERVSVAPGHLPRSLVPPADTAAPVPQFLLCLQSPVETEPRLEPLPLRLGPDPFCPALPLALGLASPRDWLWPLQLPTPGPVGTRQGPAWWFGAGALEPHTGSIVWFRANYLASLGLSFHTCQMR